ncbi:Cl- channel voltage-gated family protein [Gemmatirosa kalamazoonensis]|uniref:Cl-channel voltage-gated family protein n=1 Tax=Gemmatirosa kalamazoonensis TaxID=861299 RepID=W0R9Q5_9BACT|nr:chloride channel protein [Gemmatirosa kalamazoonensis]AHG87829.1 Cl- channel voltage-gated family protein [Gemmatirosa kalamazoonensis]
MADPVQPASRHAAAPDGAIPVAPGLEPAVESSVTATLRTPAEYEPVDRRVVALAAVCVALGVAAAVLAQVLVGLIALVTNVAFHHRFSVTPASPAGHTLGGWVVLVPVLGALVVGVMARWGSAAIRGHGIPEVMEKVLFGESRIPARVLFLKPLSAAVAIGTGGPFGAEGPIIATGGALGSLLGQLVHVTADERKTLLAAGAAAGMSATFGSPVSAVLLAVELLLFEYRPRSLVPVALAAASAAAARIAFDGSAPMFPLSGVTSPGGEAMAFYVLLGALIGALAAGITRITYGIEDGFERFGHRFHVHFMWWPAIGAVVVGLVGLVEPRTLGVGYNNIVGAIDGQIVGRALIALVVLKFVSWSIYLGSGTSGGTLAPLFTVGGGLGAWLGAAVAAAAPSLGVDARVAGLVGMAAIFAGASHALLASIVFAFETTRQPLGLLPLLGGCSAAYLAALLLNRRSIMTEKLARRGAEVRTEYAADWLSQILVRDVIAGRADIVTLPASRTLAEVRAWLLTSTRDASHQGYPVVDDLGLLVGVLTRRDLLAPEADERQTIGALVKRPPAIVFTDSTLRDAADQMVIEAVGRLPVVERHAPRRVVGIVSRSDLLAAHAPRLQAARRRGTPAFRMPQRATAAAGPDR